MTYLLQELEQEGYELPPEALADLSSYWTRHIRRFGDADAAGLIRGAILKLPDFYGPHVERSFLYDAFQAAVKAKRAQLIGPINTPHEFVFVPDVGPVVLAMVKEPRTFGHSC